MEWDPFIENKNEFSIRVSITFRVVPLGRLFCFKKKRITSVTWPSRDVRLDETRICDEILL
jgi:hypothetical protein